MADYYSFHQQLLDAIEAGEIPIIGAGRQMGKSYVNSNFLTSMREQYPPKIKWQRLPGLRLQAYTDDVAPRGFERGLNERDMYPVQAWTDECHCGTRMSFNVWKFGSEKHITMFLMKWSS